MARLSEANISHESQVSFLMKWRVLYREGPAALLAQIAPSAPLDASRPRGNAGQPLLTTRETYDLFDEIRPPRPVKRVKRPDGDY